MLFTVARKALAFEVVVISIVVAGMPVNVVSAIPILGWVFRIKNFVAPPVIYRELIALHIAISNNAETIVFAIIIRGKRIWV